MGIYHILDFVMYIYFYRAKLKGDLHILLGGM